MYTVIAGGVRSHGSKIWKMHRKGKGNSNSNKKYTKNKSKSHKNAEQANNAKVTALEPFCMQLGKKEGVSLIVYERIFRRCN